MRTRTTSSAALAVMAIVAALGAWSCGGSYEPPTATAAIQGGGGEDGVVASSAAAKITVCHKGKDLKVAAAALAGHLQHGDRLGSCAPAPACPCFTSAGLAEVASYCPVEPFATCGEPYSINVQCAPGGSISSLGLFEARLGTDTCSTTTQDLLTGNELTATLPVTDAEFEACRQAIVGSAYYPGSCPQ